MRKNNVLHKLARPLFLAGLFACLVATGGCGHKTKRGSYFDAQHGFSFNPPTGWVIKPTPGAKFPVWTDATQKGFSRIINLDNEQFDGSLDDYTNANLATLKNNKDFNIVKQDTFETDDGPTAYHLISDTTNGTVHLRQHFFLYDGGSQKFVLCYTSLAADRDTHDAEAMVMAKSFRIE
ncbi:MAG: hypothetical protein ACREJ2_06220 [Planctomycetota bacterium]